MSKYPNVLHWLNVWCRELAILQWGNSEGAEGMHSIFALTGAMQVKPLISVCDDYDEYIEQTLVTKTNGSDFVSEIMELTLRITASIDMEGLKEELKDLIEQLNEQFNDFGSIDYEDMKPLKTFVLLHRIYAVEISANIKAYEPNIHNPVLGMYRPMVEEMLLGVTKEVKGA